MLLVVDTVVMALLGVALVQEKPSAPKVETLLPSSSPPEVHQEEPLTDPVEPTEEIVIVEEPAEPPAPTKPSPPISKPKLHNMAFLYRNSRAREVWLVGDFNGWKKGKDRFLLGKDKLTWTCIKRLKDGKYAYGFWVDRRIISDPNNRRREGKRSIISLPKTER